MADHSEVDWKELVTEGHRFLKEVASRQRLTSYTEFNAVLEQRTGLPKFDFSSDRGRADVGRLLEAIAVRELEDHPAVLLTSLVIYLNANDAGPGFYALAEHRGFLPEGAPRLLKEKLWVDQVKASYAAYARTVRTR
jgi:hypothetical protein